jgi:hypothetical protein
LLFSNKYIKFFKEKKEERGVGSLLYKFDSINSSVTSGFGLFFFDVLIFYLVFFFFIIFFNFTFEFPDLFPKNFYTPHSFFKTKLSYFETFFPGLRGFEEKGSKKLRRFYFLLETFCLYFYMFFEFFESFFFFDTLFSLFGLLVGTFYAPQA